MDLLFRSLAVSPADGCLSEEPGSCAATPPDPATASAVMGDSSGKGLVFWSGGRMDFVCRKCERRMIVIVGNYFGGRERIIYTNPMQALWASCFGLPGIMKFLNYRRFKKFCNPKKYLAKQVAVLKRDSHSSPLGIYRRLTWISLHHFFFFTQRSHDVLSSLVNSDCRVWAALPEIIPWRFDPQFKVQRYLSAFQLKYILHSLTLHLLPVHKAWQISWVHFYLWYLEEKKTPHDEITLFSLKGLFFSCLTWVASIPKAFNSPALKCIIVFEVTLFTKNKQNARVNG